jgi:hypothetical protein
MKLSSSSQPHFNHHSFPTHPFQSLYHHQNGPACGANNPSGSSPVVRDPPPPLEKTLTIWQLVDSTSHHCGYGMRICHHLQRVMLTEYPDSDRHSPPLCHDPLAERTEEADAPPDPTVARPRSGYQPKDKRKCTVARNFSSKESIHDISVPRREIFGRPGVEGQAQTQPYV